MTIQSATAFTLSDQERTEIQHEMMHYEQARAASIEALKIVQKYRGWVPDEAIPAIAGLLGISASDVEGVATFYSQIYRQPVARHVIRFCDSVVCFLNDYHTIQSALEEMLSITLGQSTDDGRFTLLPTCCLGCCDKGPSMMVDEDTYTQLTVEKIATILEQYQ